MDLSRYKQKNNGLYVLSRSELDDIASSMLSKYAPDVLRYPKPLGISNLAEDSFGLTLRYEKIAKDNEILGLVVFSDGNVPCYDEMNKKITIEEQYGTVLINTGISADSDWYRRRFTIAHETAHYAIHRSYHSDNKKQFKLRSDNMAYIACRAENIGQMHFRRNLTTDNDWEEWQADGMAAALLMPKTTFTHEAMRIIRDCTGKHSLPFNAPFSVRNEVHKRLSDVFKVSKTAAEIRMKHLGLTELQNS